MTALTDYPPILPASVEVVFPTQSASNPNAPPYSKTITLASLALSQFANVLTNPTGVQVIPSGQIAIGDPPSNQTDLDNCATVTARDFYLWQQAKLDLGFAGLIAWQPEGMSDSVEWLHSGGIVRTRVQRGAWHTYAPAPPTPSAGVSGDLNSFRAPGVHYTCPITGQSILSRPCRSDEILAVPYPSPTAETLLTLGFYQTNAGNPGSLLRCAIYDVDPVTMNPRNLIVDGGDQIADDPANNETWRDVVITFTTTPGQLYYLAIQGNATAFAGGGPPLGNAAEFSWVDQIMLYNFRGLGGDADGRAKFWVSAPFAYGAFPAVFPVGSMVNEGSSGPAVAVTRS